MALAWGRLLMGETQGDGVLVGVCDACHVCDGVCDASLCELEGFTHLDELGVGIDIHGGRAQVDDPLCLWAVSPELVDVSKDIVADLLLLCHLVVDGVAFISSIMLGDAFQAEFHLRLCESDP